MAPGLRVLKGPEHIPFRKGGKGVTHATVLFLSVSVLTAMVGFSPIRAPVAGLFRLLCFLFTILFAAALITMALDYYA